MKKEKKKKSKRAEINISENIVMTEQFSVNSILLDDIDFLSRSVEMNSASLNNQLRAIENKIDSLSGLSEMDSLRLQMAMDRISKFISALSNILKKVSDSDSAIIQNIK